MEWQFHSDGPIYTQLVEQLTLRIVTGRYPPGQRLPSVRELAVEAGVNPNTMQRAMGELERKKLDMIVANNLKVAGAGFGVSTNVVTLITKDGLQELPRMGKDEVAAHLLDEIQRRR